MLALNHDPFVEQLREIGPSLRNVHHVCWVEKNLSGLLFGIDEEKMTPVICDT